MREVSSAQNYNSQLKRRFLRPTMHIAPDLKQGTSGVPRISYCKMAAPLEVILSSDSGSQLWNLTVFDLHSGSSLLSYRGGNSSARTLTLLRGQYILSAQLGKNFINVWEIQRKVLTRYTAGWSKCFGPSVLYGPPGFVLSLTI